MSSTDKNKLTTPDIISIIKACAENNVSKFNLNTLSIEFGQSNKVDDEIITQPLSQEEHTAMDKQTLLQEEMRMRDEKIKMMLLENPLLAEELISNGDLDESDGDIGDGEDEEDGETIR